MRRRAACHRTPSCGLCAESCIPLSLSLPLAGYPLFPRDVCDIATALTGTWPTYPDFTAATAIWTNGKNVPSRNGGTRALKGERARVRAWLVWGWWV